MNQELNRVLDEVADQNGDNTLAPDLTREQWAKVVARAGADYGSDVEVAWGGKLKGITDHGVLIALPGCYDSWDMDGVVYIPRPWVEKERPIPEWHSLYSLCRNEMVLRIRITPR